MKNQIKVYSMGISIFLFLNIATAQVADHTAFGMDEFREMEDVEFHNIDPVFKKQLEDVFLATLTLNEAFIEGDVAKVRAATSDVKNKIGRVDMMLLSADPHMRWLDYLELLYSDLKQISSASTIDSQRGYFAKYNRALYKSIKIFGIEKEAYYQFCPMAINDQGAFWLSDHDYILNPYMGDAMLSCGIVTDVVN